LGSLRRRTRELVGFLPDLGCRTHEGPVPASKSDQSLEGPRACHQHEVTKCSQHGCRRIQSSERWFRRFDPGTARRIAAVPDYVADYHVPSPLSFFQMETSLQTSHRWKAEQRSCRERIDSILRNARFDFAREPSSCRAICNCGVQRARCADCRDVAGLWNHYVADRDRSRARTCGSGSDRAPVMVSYAPSTRVQKSAGAPKREASTVASSRMRRACSTPLIARRCHARFRVMRFQSSRSAGDGPESSSST
jgi:hypothetical protein